MRVIYTEFLLLVCIFLYDLREPKIDKCWECCSSKKTGKGKKPGKGGNHFWKSIGLGIKTPRDAIEGRSKHFLSLVLFVFKNFWLGIVFCLCGMNILKVRCKMQLSYLQPKFNRVQSILISIICYLSCRYNGCYPLVDAVLVDPVAIIFWLIHPCYTQIPCLFSCNLKAIPINKEVSDFHGSQNC